MKKHKTVGRPKLGKSKKKMASYRFDPWFIDWLRKQDESASVIMQNAVIKQHKIKVPK